MALQKIKPTAMMAEFVGTFGFVLALLGSVNGVLSGSATAVFGALALGFFVLALAKVSGSHFNPALTFAAWTTKKIDTMNGLAYMVAQFSGALLAWVVLGLFLGDSVYGFASPENTWPVFWGELMGTAFLGFGLAAVMHHKYEGLAAAATMGVSLLMGISLATLGANGIINPALAAAGESFNLAYVVGPLLGATFGMWLFSYLMTPKGKL